MKKASFWLTLLIVAATLAACAPTPTPTLAPTLEPTLTSAPTNTPEPSATSEPTATATATITATPIYPTEGYGPTNFPENIDPLTGLKVTDPAILNRRPILVKVENLPRKDRPQYGLSFADIVYEFYTEQGTTRFAALFYGQDAKQVMPIRSARWSDINLIRMYKSIFVFGSAYQALYSRLVGSDFSNRLVLESPGSCPSVCRFEPKTKNFLYTDTAALQEYLTKRGIDNTKQNLDGMHFNLLPPTGGSPADQVFARFSGAIYNRWDYDPATGKYMRFSDSADDTNNNNPQYAQLTDALTKQPIAYDNVVIIQVRHNNISPAPPVEIIDMSILGTGTAYVARDGQLYKVNWSRMAEDQVLTLTNEDGTPFAFKPGQTWVEVMTLNTAVKQDGNAWHFTLVKDW